MYPNRCPNPYARDTQAIWQLTWRLIVRANEGSGIRIPFLGTWDWFGEWSSSTDTSDAATTFQEYCLTHWNRRETDLLAELSPRPWLAIITPRPQLRVQYCFIILACFELGQTPGDQLHTYVHLQGSLIEEEHQVQITDIFKDSDILTLSIKLPIWF